MPTAREVLAQADVLMLRAAAGAADTHIPELTEEVVAEVALPPSPATITLAEVPELTDAVEEIEITSLVDGAVQRGEQPNAGRDRDPGVSPVAFDPLPSSSGEPQTPIDRNDDPATLSVVDASIPISDGPMQSEPLGVDNWARWEALGDEIRMQVLQRVELYAGTGLSEELSARLQPIVERASAQMLATINEQVGFLLRAYVAQVIEHEIEKRRKGKA